MQLHLVRCLSKLSVTAGLAVTLVSSAAWAQRYQQTNLVADTSGPAAHTDTNLVNAWGIARGSGGPWWIANNGTGTSTIYDGSGVASSLIVTTQSDPSGTIFNGTGDFGGAHFLFASEDGTISAWKSGTQATVVVTTPNAVYKGLAIASISGTNYLYVADFRNNRIDVFDTNFQPVSLTMNGYGDYGSRFFQAEHPHGFAPFNIQNVAGMLVVTYAKQDAQQHDDVPGPGLGYVAAFTPSGRLIRHFQPGPWLNSPWGIVLAPGDFGSFSHDLLIGQFGSGQIAAYNIFTGAFDGLLQDATGTTIAIDGLWGLAFGDGKTSGAANALYFTAGPAGESHGLFGNLTPISSDLTLGTGR